MAAQIKASLTSDSEFVPCHAFFPGTRRNLLKNFKMFTNPRVKQLKFSASLLTACFPWRTILSEGCCLLLLTHFSHAPYLIHLLPAAGRVALPRPAQHQPLLTSPGDPDSNTLVLHFLRFLAPAPQGTAPRQAGAGGESSQATPYLHSHRDGLPPVPRVPTCTVQYLQPLQP